MLVQILLLESYHPAEFSSNPNPKNLNQLINAGFTLHDFQSRWIPALLTLHDYLEDYESPTCLDI